MPISKSEHLYDLIKSLSKSEKRNFHLYANRLQGNDSKLFIQLFELIDKQKIFDEKRLKVALKDLNSTQYSNLKRHLYTQIVISLRLIHKQRRKNIQVREQLDFAYILYGKGLYLQSLKLLGMAKRLADKHHLNYSKLTIIEFEKFIESRHITRSKQNRDKDLINEAEEIKDTISKAIDLSNLRIRLHGKYLRYGHVKNDFERKELVSFFENAIENIPQEDLGVMERVFLYQSYVWYNYILLDFKACLKWAKLWVDLLKEEPEMQWRDIDLFMRGYHYILTAAFQIGDKKIAGKYLDEFEKFRNSEYKKFNLNSQITAFLYVHLGRLNKAILHGDYKKGIEYIPKTLKRIKRYEAKLDEHRILVFYYKIAWIFMAIGESAKAIDYLTHIVNQDNKKLRQDLQGYARLLYLICHYELENYDLLRHLSKTMKPYFDKQAENEIHQTEILNCLEELSKKPEYEHKESFKKYLKIFKSIEDDIYSKRSTTYLDFSSWLKSKQRKISLGEVVRKK